MTNLTKKSLASKLFRIVQALCFLFLAYAPATVRADDWGAYSIVPATTRGFVLEAVGGGTNEGTVVSIGKPTGAASQKWVIHSQGNDLFSISPSHAANLVLAASRGSVKQGTLIVLETDREQPWQRWAIRKNEDGSYCMLPKHAPGKALDHLGGDPEAGCPDRHLGRTYRGICTCNGSSGRWRVLRAPRPRGSRRPAHMWHPRSSRKPFSRDRSSRASSPRASSSRAPMRQVTVFIPGAVRRLQAGLRLRQDRRL